MLKHIKNLRIWNNNNDNIKWWNEDKIVKSFEDSGLLLKRDSKTIENEPRVQKGGFLNIFLGTLGASLSGNILSGKGIHRAEVGFIRSGHGP